MFSLKRDVAVIRSVNIQAISSDTTTAGNAIDLQDYQGCLFVLEAGAITDGDYAILLEESDTGVFSGEENAVADADLDGTEALASFTANDDDNKVGTVSYIGEKRYVRASIVSTNTSTGGTVGVLAIKSRGLVKPDTTNDAIA
jgi:hypothetical protein